MNPNNIITNADFTASTFKIEEYCQTITSDFTNWLANEYKSANEALYGILARCYALSLAYDASEVVKKKVESHLTERKVPKRNKPNPHGRVLNLVFFGKDYLKRRSVYSKALTKAQADNVEAKNLPAWLINNGGLEAIRDTVRKSKKDLDVQKAEYQDKGCKVLVGRNAVSTTAIADLPVEKATNGVLIVLCKVDGKTAVPVVVVDDEKPIDAVLKWVAEKLAA
jgi:hypothetical protein